MASTQKMSLAILCLQSEEVKPPTLVFNNELRYYKQIGDESEEVEPHTLVFHNELSHYKKMERGHLTECVVGDWIVLVLHLFQLEPLRGHIM